MKISIGSKVEEGPFGGGNSFIHNLKNELLNKGHIVIDHLNDKDIDIILLFNPFISSKNATFNNFDIDYYQTFINKNAISVQRINECDERKNTNHVNKKIILNNRHIDANIYVSSWIKKLYHNQGILDKYQKVILGGPNKNIFNSSNKQKWNKNNKLKIVTHHWSDNLMKGFKVYKELDDLIEKEYWSKKIEFTLIGNQPSEIIFNNTKIIPPLSHEQLSKELKKHDVYITASLNEPSGNHHMEAALTRLPIIYIDSGGTTEYCENFGIKLNNNNLDSAIEEIINKYDSIWDELDSYEYDFQYAFDKYVSFFEELNANKIEVISKRTKKLKIKVVYEFFINKIKKSIFWQFIYFKMALGKIKRSMRF